jgi:hypothetical protein
MIAIIRVGVSAGRRPVELITAALPVQTRRLLSWTTRSCACKCLLVEVAHSSQTPSCHAELQHLRSAGPRLHTLRIIDDRYMNNQLFSYFSNVTVCSSCGHLQLRSIAGSRILLLEFYTIQIYAWETNILGGIFGHFSAKIEIKFHIG